MTGSSDTTNSFDLKPLDSPPHPILEREFDHLWQEYMGAFRRYLHSFDESVFRNRDDDPQAQAAEASYWEMETRVASHPDCSPFAMAAKLAVYIQHDRMDDLGCSSKLCSVDRNLLASYATAARACRRDPLAEIRQAEAESIRSARRAA